MKRSMFTEVQIVGILKEVADLRQKHGVSDAPVQKWKVKFGGMDVSEAKLHEPDFFGAGLSVAFSSCRPCVLRGGVSGHFPFLAFCFR